MSRGPATFRQRDLTAAIRAVKAAGELIGRVEIGKDGKIVIIPSGKNTEAVEAAVNPWDEIHAGPVAVHP